MVMADGEEKALTHMAEHISMGSSLRSEYGSCWDGLCLVIAGGGDFGCIGGVERV